MRILFIGDIVGNPGRTMIRKWVPDLVEKHAVDITVANAENAAGGIGATPAIIRELFEAGVNAFTMGNHTWRKRELVKGIKDLGPVARPANYPSGAPGKGAHVVPLADGRKLGIVNLLGRVYMEPLECPFGAATREVAALRKETPLILVDIHAEATSEKIAMGWHLDGEVSAVVGTHTHIQTADERVLPKGTAYITDVGMTGPFDSVIGMKCEPVLKRFLTGMPTQYEVASGRPGLSGVVIDADDDTGQARSIERILLADADPLG